MISYGGRLGYADAGDTPNTQVAIHRCGDKTITFEVRGLETGPMFDAKIGDVFYGTDGIVALGDWGRGVALAPDGKVVERFGHDVVGSAYEVGTISHVGNFVDAVIRRSPAELHADVREGHLSAGLGHAAAISYRLGKPASVDEVIEVMAAFGGADDNLEAVNRTVDHLQANGVDLEVTPLQLGLALQMDPLTETFTGNEMANNMLTGNIATASKCQTFVADQPFRLADSEKSRPAEERTVNGTFASVAFRGSGRKVGFGNVLVPSQ